MANTTSVYFFLNNTCKMANTTRQCDFFLINIGKMVNTNIVCIIVRNI